MQKSEINLNVSDKPINAYRAEPENGGPGILVPHAWWGLKPFFKELCDRLAERGYAALAPDLRDGKVAETIDEAKALMKESDGVLVGKVVTAAKDYLLKYTKGEIAVMGFSMGAAWSLVVADEDPEKISVAVLFYGSQPADFKNFMAKVTGHYAEADEWEPIDEIKKMETDMKAAGVDVMLHYYPKVSHWFVESGRPGYNAASAELAHGSGRLNS